MTTMNEINTIGQICLGRPVGQGARRGGGFRPPNGERQVAMDVRRCTVRVPVVSGMPPSGMCVVGA